MNGSERCQGFCHFWVEGNEVMGEGEVGSWLLHVCSVLSPSLHRLSSGLCMLTRDGDAVDGWLLSLCDLSLVDHLEVLTVQL